MRSYLSMLLLLSHFSRVRLCDPIDGSPPGSSVPGILQARTLEWVAISFSNAWKWKVKVKSLSHVWLLATPWTAAYQAPPPMGFSRQEYWSGVPLPSPIPINNHLKCKWVRFSNQKTMTGQMDTKTRALFMLSTRNPPQTKGHIQTESEGLEKVISYKWRPKESRSSNTHIR